MQINDFRQQHPEYDDMSTPDLCRCLHAKYYPDMPKDQFDLAFIGRPNHDDLETAAVTGKDSLDLQEMAPEVKPVVKMTIAEFADAQIPPVKPFFSPGNGSVYVFAENAQEITDAIEAILSGDDSAVLGYPEKGGADMVVTKDGRVVSDLPTMHQEAQGKNLIWGANGSPEELSAKAQEVADAVNGRRLK